MNAHAGHSVSIGQSGQGQVNNWLGILKLLLKVMAYNVLYITNNIFITIKITTKSGKIHALNFVWHCINLDHLN